MLETRVINFIFGLRVGRVSRETNANFILTNLEILRFTFEKKFSSFFLN